MHGSPSRITVILSPNVLGSIGSPSPPQLWAIFFLKSQLCISFSRRSYSWRQVTFANIHSKLLRVFSWPGSSFLCISGLDVIIVPLMKNISVANMTKASISVSVQISASLGKRSKDWNHGTSRSESVSCVNAAPWVSWVTLSLLQQLCPFIFH